MRLLVFLLCMGFFVGLGTHASAQTFFQALPDVPLMSGLTEMNEGALSFDKPEGRIMQGAAFMGDSITADAVQTYYMRALPQFGWRKRDAFYYVRGEETLQIHMKESDAGRILEITISP